MGQSDFLVWLVCALPSQAVSLTFAPAASWWQWSDWSSPPGDWSYCSSSSSRHQTTDKWELLAVISSSNNYSVCAVCGKRASATRWGCVCLYLHLLVHFYIDGFDFIQLMSQSDQCVLLIKTTTSCSHCHVTASSFPQDLHCIFIIDSGIKGLFLNLYIYSYTQSLIHCRSVQDWTQDYRDTDN